MAHYQDFENWLKSNKYVSWKTYLSFMKTIDKELSVSDFHNITSTSILQQLLTKLQEGRSFRARSKSDRDNIISGFRTYILFMEERKQILK